MPYNLRIPPVLDIEARARCERLGISLNALICVALDAYLREPSASPPGASSALPAVAGVALGHVAAVSASEPAPVKLTKQQRRELTAAKRQANKH